MGELQSKSADNSNVKKNSHFPFFINSKNKKAVVVGGGEIALRRIKALCKFEYSIYVIAPEIHKEIEELANEQNITIIKNCFEEGYIKDAFVVVAATNNRAVNCLVGKICRKNKILVSVADKKEECTFYFPAIVEGDIVIALCADGKNHKSVSEKAKKIRNIITKI